MQDPSASELFSWAETLFPLHRSLTGEGNRETLRFLQQKFPLLKLQEVRSGTVVEDWRVPQEWEVSEAFIEDSEGNVLVDYKQNNLHVVAYSTPVEGWFTWEELRPHLHTHPDPESIPYVTSYYRADWGFCARKNDVDRWPPGPFRVKIASRLFDGSMSFADALIPGESSSEVLLSSYICHPSLANNEVSGPVVLTALARWIEALPTRRLSYRIYLGPETIGPIAYLASWKEHLKRKVVAGWVLTCVGDDETYSYVPTPLGETLADRVSVAVLREHYPAFQRYSFLDRGSDERQWASPNLGLPVCSVMRSKYGYPGYHTSKDNLELISPAGLGGALEVYKKLVLALEANHVYRVTTGVGEPFMSKRNLYSSLSFTGSDESAKAMMNLLAYTDGTRDLLAACELAQISPFEGAKIAAVLVEVGILEPVLTTTHRGIGNSVRTTYRRFFGRRVQK